MCTTSVTNMIMVPSRSTITKSMSNVSASTQGFWWVVGVIADDNCVHVAVRRGLMMSGPQTRQTGTPAGSKDHGWRC